MLRTTPSRWAALLQCGLFGVALAAPTQNFARQDTDTYEYIVVGSGPGGGPLAANLAEAGHSVLLLEAGTNQTDNILQKVPAFFGYSQTDEKQSWHFYIKNYSNDTLNGLDEKMIWLTPNGTRHHGLNPPEGSTQLGVFYPRAGTLGGCDTHNGGITVLPPQKDWDNIVQITNDSTWEHDKMRAYFEKIERNLYLPEGTPGHGYDGYLTTTLPNKTLIEKDPQLVAIAQGAAAGLGHADRANSTDWDVILQRDINHLDPGRDAEQDAFQMPYKIDEMGRRDSAANRVNDAFNAGYPLTVRFNSLVSKVVFDDNLRATGVEYFDGESLYRADPRSGNVTEGTKRTVTATREIIIAGGAFNSPQILMLSGVGPADELKALGIPVVVDSPSVGKNLQDHTEVNIINKFPEAFTIWKGCEIVDGHDVCLEQWNETGTGPFTGTGFSIMGLYTSSVSEDGLPDIGYYGDPAYIQGPIAPDTPVISVEGAYTFAMLKAHGRNRAGQVTLRTSDPRDVPDINFEFFADGGDEDVQAMVEGIQKAREIFAAVPEEHNLYQELYPGSGLTSTEQLESFIRSQSYSHHPTSTCAIGTVVDSKFRVNGVTGLRVVDASVFPTVPGTFPVIAVFMISEKASADILADLA